MEFMDRCKNLVGKEVLRLNGMCYFCSAVKGRGDELPLALINVSLGKTTAKNLSLPVGMNKGYEVWILRPDKRNERYANTWLVRFPSNEDFGSYGWSYQSLDHAKNKLKELTEVTL